MKNARARRKPSKLPMIFYLTAFSFLVMTLSAGLLYGSWVLNIRTGLVRFQELTLDRLLLWALIISVVVSTGIVSVLGNHFVFKSVRELSDASRRVAAGDFSLHIGYPERKGNG